MPMPWTLLAPLVPQQLKAVLAGMLADAGQMPSTTATRHSDGDFSLWEFAAVQEAGPPLSFRVVSNGSGDIDQGCNVAVEASWEFAAWQQAGPPLALKAAPSDGDQSGCSGDVEMDDLWAFAAAQEAGPPHQLADVQLVCCTDGTPAAVDAQAAAASASGAPVATPPFAGHNRRCWQC